MCKDNSSGDSETNKSSDSSNSSTVDTSDPRETENQSAEDSQIQPIDESSEASLDETTVEQPSVEENRAPNINLIRRHKLTYVAPLPPPEFYLKYEQALHGSADRIMTMAEKEQTHRHENDRMTSKAMHRLAFTNSISSTLVMLALVSTTGILGWLGAVAPTLILSITTIGGVGLLSFPFIRSLLSSRGSDNEDSER